MPWLDLKSKLDWFDSDDNWSTDPGAPVSHISPAEIEEVEKALQRLYSSPTAAAYLDQLSARPAVRIAHADLDPGIARGGNDLTTHIGINYSKISQLRYFNNNGTVVAENSDLTLIHELRHLNGDVDPLGTGPNDKPTDAEENAASWSTNGPVLAFQNIVARELGHTTLIQPSYHASFMTTDTTMADNFDEGVSYTDGAEVDTVRLAWVAGDNNMDQSAHGSSRDLMFGLDGDDTMVGADGNDFLYGGKGNDKIDGGKDFNLSGGLFDGYDNLKGEDGNDTLYGGAGDTLTGGDGDDEFHLSTVDVIQLKNDGVVLSAGLDSKYYDFTKWYLFQTFVDPDGESVEWDTWAIPIVTITDFGSGDKLYVDNKLITGKTVNYSGESASGTFSWREQGPWGTRNDNWPFNALYDEELPQTADGFHWRTMYEDYFDQVTYWEHVGPANYDPVQLRLYWDTNSFEFYDVERNMLYGPGGVVTTYDAAFAAGLIVLVPNQSTVPLIPETIVVA